MALVIEQLPPEVARNAGILDRLVELINRSYSEAEEGLWVGDVRRTDHHETRASIEAGWVLVAQVDGVLAGTVQTHAVDEGTFTFGTLAVEGGHGRAGIGSALVQRVEQVAAEAGATSVRLEVLVASPARPHQQRLGRWYAGMGYHEVDRVSLHQVSPKEVAFLARPSEVSLMAKALAG